MSANRIKKRALEIAQSGDHIDCLTIELALAKEGFPDAYEALKDAAFRAHLK